MPGTILGISNIAVKQMKVPALLKFLFYWGREIGTDRNRHKIEEISKL